MSRIIFVPYKMGSNSVRELVKSLAGYNTRRVKPDGKYKPFRSHFIINWGMGSIPQWYSKFTALGMVVSKSFLNHPDKTKIASNKLSAFTRMKDKGVSVPEFTTDRKVAEDWVKKHTVVARKLLSGHSGAGIEIIEPKSEVVDAPLYVIYVKKKAEYRIHVFKGDVIDIQHKRKKLGLEKEDIDTRVRNHDNGWVFCKEGVNPPKCVLEESIKAMEALQLDFGAVDVIYNGLERKAYVLEINCAPGLEGSTVTSYKDAIIKWSGVEKRTIKRLRRQL